jgi:hypothetical protein
MQVAPDLPRDRPALEVRRALPDAGRGPTAPPADHGEQVGLCLGEDEREALGRPLDVAQGAGPFDPAERGVDDDDLLGRNDLA